MNYKTLILATLLLLPMFVVGQQAQVDGDSATKRDELYKPVTFDTKIKDIDVKTRATRAEQKGDTLVYNAEAFKVLEGSTAEDLLAKMPGVVVEGGTVQAQGETVQKVLVDGKEFFEGDVNLAIRNIPSDVIKSIELFDKKSDQAEFTGFDDGEEIKTINIVTKSGYTEGKFGEVAAGYGTDDRYKVSGNINIFDNDQRISILGMSNNVNQQNFSSDDLAGVMSSSSGRGKGPKGGGGGGASSSANNFMISSTDGITTSHGAGLNYVNKFGEKIDFTGSYFFNMTDSYTDKESWRKYFDSDLANLLYDEDSTSDMDNMNHRFNSRITYTINSTNSLVITPSFSFQDNESLSTLLGTYTDFDDDGNETVETTDSKTSSTTNAYNGGLNIVYRHRFPAVGRTLSVMLNGTASNRDGTNYSDYYNTLEQIATGSITDDTYIQNKISDRKSYSLRGSVIYTEALSKRIMLSTSYKVSYSKSDSAVDTYRADAVNSLDMELMESDPTNASLFNTELSSDYNSNYITQSVGAGLRFVRGRRFMAMVDGSAQYATLDGSQLYPVANDNINHSYLSFLPTVFMRYSLNETNSFMFRLNTRSESPSITDLQEVVDNSNSFFLTSGNSELDQQLNYSANVRYLRTTKSGHTFIAMASGTISQDYVSDDTIMGGDFEVNGTTYTLSDNEQYTRPINMSGYYTARLMVTYGFPVDFIRSNVNFSVAANYENEPTLFNGVKSYTRELTYTPKVVIGSNISKYLDFTVTYSAGISQALSSSDGSTSDDYISHSAGAKFGWRFYKTFTFRSTYSFVGYSGLDTSEYNYNLWNASLGKKFLKNERLEAIVEATDLLRQLSSFKRTVGSNYYQYTNSNVLEPYVMFRLVYKIK